MNKIEENSASSNNELILIICIGLPASGKSTYAKNWVNQNPETRIRVNRDDIRRMVGPYLVFSREKLVTTIEKNMVYEGLMAGYNVVVDATNLNQKYYRWPQLLKEWSSDIHFPNVELIENKSFLDVPIEECIRRDLLRGEESVGEEVIRKMASHINENNETLTNQA